MAPELAPEALGRPVYPYARRSGRNFGPPPYGVQNDSICSGQVISPTHWPSHGNRSRLNALV